MLEIQQYRFDWRDMDDDTRAFVLEKTEAIKARMKRTAEDIVAIGRMFAEVQARLSHQQFLGWVETEFEMGERAAEQYMLIARRFNELPNRGSSLSFRVLRELAAPSMPKEVIEQVASGQIPASLPAIREAKAAFAPPPAPTLPTYEPPASSVPPAPRPAPVTPLYERGTVALPRELEHLAPAFEQPEEPEPGTRFLTWISKAQRIFDAVNQSSVEYDALNGEEIKAGIRLLSVEDQARYVVMARMVRNWTVTLESHLHHNPEKPFTIIPSEGDETHG